MEEPVVNDFRNLELHVNLEEITILLSSLMVLERVRLGRMSDSTKEIIDTLKYRLTNLV